MSDMYNMSTTGEQVHSDRYDMNNLSTTGEPVDSDQQLLSRQNNNISH